MMMTTIMMMKIYIYILGQCHDFDPKALVQYRHSKKKHGKKSFEYQKGLSQKLCTSCISVLNVFLVLPIGIISWTQSEMNSYVLGGMVLSKEKYLLLPSEGYYDVQTRIQMDTYTLDLQPSRETPVRLAVNVMEENGHIRTLMEEKFILGPKQMFGKQLGPTMFYLSKGSAVYVVINAHEYINPNKHSMFNIRKWSN